MLLRTLQFDQQAVLHAMRLHFEQIRLAAMLEHKSMEAQLRKLASHMNKTQRRIDAIEERENRLKEEVSAQVRGIWDPKVQKVKKRQDETLEKVRLRVSARMARVEAEVKEKVNASFSDLLSELQDGLEQAQLEMERKHAIFEDKSREAKKVHANLEGILLEEFSADAAEAKAKEKADAKARLSLEASLEDLEKVAAARRKCLEPPAIE